MDSWYSDNKFNIPKGYDLDRIVLIARDPHTLYTYWEISQSRINALLLEFGHELFEKSTPAIKVTNISKNSSMFVMINEYANNWYINVEDANCMYIVEIGRRVSDMFFIPLASSNYVLTPGNAFSTNTAAYFADYCEIRKGNYSFETGEIYRSYSLSDYYESLLGTSSLEMFGMNRQESIFGPSSAELYGFNPSEYYLKYLDKS
jgi:hypothetical protein